MAACCLRRRKVDARALVVVVACNAFAPQLPTNVYDMAPFADDVSLSKMYRWGR